MPKKAAEMSALAVQRLKTPGLHMVGGVAGLGLQVSASGARSWVLRAMVADKRRDLGLGGFPDVTLADAREAARRYRAQIAEGVDPAAQRKEARRALASARAGERTFDQCAESYIAAHEASWRNTKHGVQWRNTIKTYASPVIGAMVVRSITTPNLLAVLEPHWKTKTETMKRLRGRIESILDYAAVAGYREGLNPARWRGHLDKMLAAPAKVAPVEHHRALPVREVPAFMAKLRKMEGVSARALEFAILTAARSGEVRMARWSEVDLKSSLWVVPADRMKAGREHRVPLSPSAVELLKGQPREANNDLIFPGPRTGKPLSDMSLLAVTRRLGVDAVPHGFRSSFRDWCAEHTNYPREVAELALAHAIGDKVEAAYRRGDLFKKRQALMLDWDNFVTNSIGPQ